MITVIKLLVALLIAAMVAASILAFATCFVTLEPRNGSPETVFNPINFLLFGPPIFLVTLSSALIFGIPSYYILQRLHLLKLWSVIGIGGFAGFVVGGILAYERGWALFGWLFTHAVVGALAAFSAWLILRVFDRWLEATASAEG